MKFSCLALVALAHLGQVNAFPAMGEALIEDAIREIEERMTPKGEALRTLEKRQGQKGGFPEPKPIFVASEQLVSVEGKHKFVPPNFEAGDQRGPCPGLNAMANHGYLPHNGIGNGVDFIKGTFEVFGMGPDLANVLTTIGQTIDGNGLEWSIGGPSKFLPSPVKGLLGTPQGISGSHNKYESDVSPGRGDLYKFGDDYRLQLDQFKQLYDMGQARGDQYSLATLQEFREMRFNNSIATNPYLFLGPFSGVLVAPAAFEFIYRFMSNKSEEHPRGLLNGNVLMSFFGVTKNANGEFEHKNGYERIPYNWYKRALTDPYTQTTLTADTIVAAKNRPQFASVGGNNGKVNTFKGIDIEQFSNGVFNSKSLLKGNNLACFAYGFQAQASPDLIKCSGAIANAEAMTKKVQGAIGKILTELKCPKLKGFDNNQFKSFPGYTKLNCKTGKYTE